ncbi:hypothetical protein NKH36_16750 [Mesorhizobium sp. M1312]|uniref:hypothetical protein n=1 Tax=unclassified Mesorhizobium TaxID=325217 RepID=UPI00333AEACA
MVLICANDPPAEAGFLFSDHLRLLGLNCRRDSAPSVLPDISPTWGEIGSFDHITHPGTSKIGESEGGINSPQVGEMAGRPEGGAKERGLPGTNCNHKRPPMSNRYATIITDDDGREVVSAIGQFEGAPDARHGRVEPVAAGVRIGMVRGGPVDAAGGFGSSQMGVSAGAVSIAKAALKALPEAGAARPDAASRPRKPKAKRPGKRAKSRKKPTAALKKAAKPKLAAVAGAVG